VIAIIVVASMSDRKESQGLYCLGQGRFSKPNHIVLAALATSGELDTCPGCAGTGRLKRETGDDATIDMPGIYDYLLDLGNSIAGANSCRP
jgi:hypothetical protein